MNTRRLVLAAMYHVAPIVGGAILLACVAVGVHGLITEEASAIVVGLILTLSLWQLKRLGRLLWRRSHPEPISGVTLVAGQHPRLSRLIEECCRDAKVSVPERITIIHDSDVIVWRTRNRKELGLPFSLLIELSAAELRAVLVAELVLQRGVEGDRDEALLARLGRHLTAAEAVGGWFAQLWADWMDNLSMPLLEARAAEAARTAVRATDVETVLSAASGEMVADLATSDLDRVLELFAVAQRRASLREHCVAVASLPVTWEAVAEVWEEGCWPREKAEIASGFEVPTPPSREWVTRDAIGLLDPDSNWWTQVEGSLLGREFEQMPWQQLAATAGLHADGIRLTALDAELRHRGLGGAGIGNVLTVLERGALPRDWDGLAVPDVYFNDFELFPDDDPDVPDGEAPGPWVRGCVAALRCALSDVGCYRFDPERGIQFLLDDEVVDLEREVVDAVATRDTTRLRSLLALHGVDPERAALQLPESAWLGCITHVRGPWSGRCDMHLLTDGVLLVPIPHGERRRDENSFGWETQAERVFRTWSLGAGARTLEGARWVPVDSITGGSMRRRILSLRASFDLGQGDPMSVRDTIESESFDSEEGVDSALRWLTAPR